MAGDANYVQHVNDTQAEEVIGVQYQAGGRQTRRRGVSGTLPIHLKKGDLMRDMEQVI